MKKTLLALFVLTAAAFSRAQDVPLTEVLGPNNSFKDSLFGVSLTYPAGWEVVGGFRWGKNNGENTFRFRPLWPSEARPSLYYQRFTPEHPRPADITEWFRESARKKEESRGGPARGYRNLPESFSIKTVNGLDHFSYMATFTAGKQQMVEYFIRIAGKEAYTMFFTTGTFDEINAIRADLDRMAETIRVP